MGSVCQNSSIDSKQEITIIFSLPELSFIDCSGFFMPITQTIYTRSVAQLEEFPASNGKGAGSNPARPSIF